MERHVRVTCQWLARNVWWLLPLALAVVLRLLNLPEQVLIDDETHALRYAHARDAAWIVTNYSGTDYGRPLALLCRAYWGIGLRIGEMDLRVPGLLAGFLLVVGLPLAVRRAGLVEVSAWLCWLLATSPLLVLHSRIARTYMPATLLALAAVCCALAWMERGGRRWAGAYAVCAALAPLWHVVCVPLVLLPLPFAAVREVLVPVEKRRGWLALSGVSVATVGGLVALQLPALESLLMVARRKAGAGSLSWNTLSANAWLQAGSTSVVVVCLFFGLVLLGAWHLRQRATILWFTITLVVGHLVALWALHPTGVDNPHVFARYFVIALPLVLFWAACGLVELSRIARTRLAGVAFLLLLAGTGPLARPVYWRSTLSHHVALLRFDCPPPEFPLNALSPFYAELGRRPGSAPLIEFPWDVTSASGATFALQQRHRQTVIAAPGLGNVLSGSEFRLRWIIAPTPGSFLASPARYLVVHRDLPAEERLLTFGTCPALPSSPLPLERIARAMEQNLRASWGAPVFEDALIVVWDLDRLRPAGGQLAPPRAAEPMGS
jgi:hypothetical protein